MVAAQRDMLAFVASVLDVPDLEYKDRAKMVSNFVQTRTGVSEAQRKALEANALRVLGQNVAVNGAPAGQAPVATASHGAQAGLGAQAGPSALAGPVAGPGGAKAHPPAALAAAPTLTRQNSGSGSSHSAASSSGRSSAFGFMADPTAGTAGEQLQQQQRHHQGGEVASAAAAPAPSPAVAKQAPQPRGALDPNDFLIEEFGGGGPPAGKPWSPDAVPAPVHQGPQDPSRPASPLGPPRTVSPAAVNKSFAEHRAGAAVVAVAGHPEADGPLGPVADRAQPAAGPSAVEEKPRGRRAYVRPGHGRNLSFKGAEGPAQVMDAISEVERVEGDATSFDDMDALMAGARHRRRDSSDSLDSMSSVGSQGGVRYVVGSPGGGFRAAPSGRAAQSRIGSQSLAGARGSSETPMDAGLNGPVTPMAPEIRGVADGPLYSQMSHLDLDSSEPPVDSPQRWMSGPGAPHAAPESGIRGMSLDGGGDPDDDLLSVSGTVIEKFPDEGEHYAPSGVRPSVQRAGPSAAERQPEAAAGPRDEGDAARNEPAVVAVVARVASPASQRNSAELSRSPRESLDVSPKGGEGGWGDSAQNLPSLEELQRWDFSTRLESASDVVDLQGMIEQAGAKQSKTLQATAQELDEHRVALFARMNMARQELADELTRLRSLEDRQAEATTREDYETAVELETRIEEAREACGELEQRGGSLITDVNHAASECDNELNKLSETRELCLELLGRLSDVVGERTAAMRAMIANDIAGIKAAQEDRISGASNELKAVDFEREMLESTETEILKRIEIESQASLERKGALCEKRDGVNAEIEEVMKKLEALKAEQAALDEAVAKEEKELDLIHQRFGKPLAETREKRSALVDVYKNATEVLAEARRLISQSGAREAEQVRKVEAMQLSATHVKEAMQKLGATHAEEEARRRCLAEASRLRSSAEMEALDEAREVAAAEGNAFAARVRMQEAASRLIRAREGASAIKAQLAAAQSRIPELEEGKALAVSTRNFKEAARVSAELKETLAAIAELEGQAKRGAASTKEAANYLEETERAHERAEKISKERQQWHGRNNLRRAKAVLAVLLGGAAGDGANDLGVDSLNKEVEMLEQSLALFPDDLSEREGDAPLPEHDEDQLGKGILGVSPLDRPVGRIRSDVSMATSEATSDRSSLPRSDTGNSTGDLGHFHSEAPHGERLSVAQLEEQLERAVKAEDWEKADGIATLLDEAGATDAAA